MVEISIASVEERRTAIHDFGMESGDWFYVAQYDLPGVALPDGDAGGKHHHIIPLVAVADHMLTVGVDSMEAGFEFCVQDRVAAIYADELEGEMTGAPVALARPDVIPGQQRRNEALAKARSAIKADVLETAKGVVQDQDASTEEIMENMFRMVSPSIASPPGARTMGKFSERIADLSSAMAIQGVQLNKKSRGWNTLKTLAMNSKSKVLEAQHKAFEIRYGQDLRGVIEYEKRMEKLARENTGGKI